MKQNILNHFLIIFMFMVLSFMSCQKKPSEEIIAKAGIRYVDWTELHRSFNLEPKWERGMIRQDAYRVQLEYLITSKLFAQEARKQKLDTISGVRRQLDFILEKEMLKELYRERVTQQVTIPEDELKKAYENGKKRFKLAYIQSTDSLKAVEIRRKAMASNRFDSSMCDHTSIYGTTDYLGFGEMVPALEKIVFSLGLNDVSIPVKVNGIYMIVKILDGRQELFKSDLDYVSHKSKIKKILFERKAAAYSHQFLYEVLHDQNVRLNAAAFLPLASAFETHIKNKQTNTPFAVQVNDVEIGHIRHDVNSLLDKPIVTFREGQFTVREFLEYLSRMPRGLRPKVKMKNQLKLAVGMMVRNAYLLKIARAQHLEENSRVKYETQIQQDKLLSDIYKNILRRQIQIAADELDSFMHSPAYEEIEKRLDKKLTRENATMFLKDYKLSNKIAAVSDSLRNIYGIDINETAFMSHLDSPNEILNGNPIGFSYVENFN